MRKIILSIKPQYIEKIKQGAKTVEYRTWKPSCDLPFKVYIYSTKPIGLVVGEFIVKDITAEPIDVLWIKTKSIGGIVYDSFRKYFQNSSIGYAFHIEDLTIYNNAKNLYMYGMSKPPQRFRYLNEE